MLVISRLLSSFLVIFDILHIFSNESTRLMAIGLVNHLGPDSGKKTAECSRAFGRSLENHGFYDEAAEKLEDYLTLTKEYQ